MRRIIILILFSLPHLVSAQYQFRYKNNIPMSINGEILKLPWAGGLNSAQFQKFDLNGDGIEDLVIYNRISQELTTFLTIDNQYVFNLDYASKFPDEVEDWLILKDFDCDGKKDIFTSTPFGIKVFRNISTGNDLAWEEAADFLRFDTGINLQVNASDIPGIEDIDGDGDLDILAYRFSTASTIDYYKNTSIETTGNCGQLTFIRETRMWGGFEECNCNDISFGGTGCASGGVMNGEEELRIERVEHAGGKTILPLDFDNDGDMDLITSDEFCETLYFMENVGDTDNAVMTSFSSFPDFAPAAFFIFPSAFYDDFDFDGIKDLVVSTNSDQNLLDQIDFSANTTLYKNIGSNSNIVLDVPIPFLQNQMVDLGETTFPTFGDIDGDGDLDLLVGNRGVYDGSNLVASLQLFENIGTRLVPEFELADTDFLNLRAVNFRNIKPQLVDLDGDGDLDLIYVATNSSNQPILYYHLNSGPNGSIVKFGAKSIELPLSESDHPHFYDINGDGHIDLLLGTALGALRLFTSDGLFNFTEVNTEFAGIENDFNRRNVVPYVVDVDNDGRKELVTTDNSGEIRIHSGALGVDFVADSLSSNLIFNNTTNAFVLSTLGLISPMAFGDLTGSGQPDLILGNNRGGFYSLENFSRRGSVGGSSAIVVEVFPNPAQSRFFIRTDVSSTLEIYSLTGQRINSGLEIGGNVSLEIDLTGLSPGIYLVRAFNGVNQPTVKRIIVER